MFMKNCWYVAAWTSEVPAGKLLSRKILNENVLVYRGEEGKVIAMEDRCCHRGAPLSLGRLEGSNVRCMYHGLLFNPSGKCIDIPTQKLIPPALRVKSYVVHESAKMIWLWMGEAALADPGKIPAFDYLNDSEWHGIPDYLHYDANYLLITDNLSDLTHIAYVHTNTLGGSEAYAREHVQSPLVKDNDGFTLTKWHKNSDLPPFAVKVNKTLTQVDRWNTVRMKIPGYFVLESGFAPVGQDPKENSEGVLEFRNFQAMTPESDTTTHFFWIYMHKEESNIQEISTSLHDSILEGFYEDKIIIERQQKILNDDPSFKLKAIGADAPLAHLRRLIQKNIEAENEASSIGVEA